MSIRCLTWFLSLTLSSTLASCASLWTSEPEKNPEPEASRPAMVTSTAPTAKSSSTNQIETSQITPQSSEKTTGFSAKIDGNQTSIQDDEALKYTRIMARLDSMDAELRRQREKLRLLEQGLLTGIAPNDLKQNKLDAKVNHDDYGSRKKTMAREDLSRSEAPLGKPHLEDLSIPDRESSRDGVADSPVMAKIQLAKEHYQAARFGLAIAELAGISREHGDKVQDGAVKYWLAKSYLGLKEYQTARGEFESYIKNWPSGEFIATARLDLAKAFVGLGLRERAKNELRRVVKDFEGEDYAEMASAELKNIQGSL
jgi:TolA-binding protein